MPHRLTFIALTLVVLPYSASRGTTARDFADLVVHEWGTFTSIAEQDGTAVEWTPQIGPQDLPCFVNRLQVNIKGLLPGRIRMETPVLYFYAPRDVTVDVSVRFRRGVVTEWYPNGSVAPANVTPATLRHAALESSISWRNVKVTPGGALDFPLGTRASHYYAARNTDASPLQAGAERERFLFYRGVGAFEPPLRVAVDPDGRIAVSNPAGETVGDVILFENRGGAVGYEIRHTTDSEIAFDPLPITHGSLPPLQELERMLMAHGLYPKEAAAMVETWRDSWFEEGTRLFYIASREIVDAILPLQVTPAPSAVERVFVGRIELVTPARETAVRDAIARNDDVVLQKHSRFLDAIVRRVLGRSTSTERVRAEALLRRVQLSQMLAADRCR